MDKQLQVPLVNGRPVEYGYQPPKRGRPLLIGAIVLASAMVLVPLFLGIRWISPRFDLPTAAGALDADVEKAKAVGFPMVASDLAPVPSVKASENAAPMLLKATSDWEQLGDHNRFVEAILQAIAKGDYKAASSSFNDPRLASELSLAKKASELPKCDFNSDYDMGTNLLFPEFAGLKGLVKAFCLRAECEAHAGDDAAAVSDLRAAYHLGADAGSDPILISMLVRIACDSIVLASEERCVADAKTPAAVQAYVDFLAEPRPPFDNVRILKGEAYMGVATIRNLSLFSKRPSTNTAPIIDPSKLQRLGMPTSLVSKAYMARHLETWTEVLTGASSMQGNPSALFAHVASVADRVEKEQGFSYVLEAILDPVYDHMGDTELRNEAMWNDQKALAKVLLYRAQRGAFPDTLESAGAAEPDPFSNGSLKYLKTSAGVRIYSVGADRRDDHGVRRSERYPNRRYYERTTWDEVASYPPPVRMPYVSRTRNSAQPPVLIAKKGYLSATHGP